MSTTTEPTPPAPVLAPIDLRPVETAPSQTLVQGPGFARTVGFAGLFALVLGAVVVITNMALSPRWITTGWGYLFSAVGIVLLMYHAVSDTEPEIRRMYGLFSALWLVLAIIASVAPGPVFTPAASGANKTMGFNLLPWGVGFGFLSLLFAIPFARQETDKTYRSYVDLGMLGVGTLLAVGSLLAGLIAKDFLVGPGIALALLGLGFLAAYMGQVDTSEGIGFKVAFALGAVGAAVALYAIGQTTVPTLLYEGPNVLRKPTGSLDWWKVAARFLAIVIFAGIAATGWSMKGAAVWLRSALSAVGIAGVGVLLLASFKANVITTPPGPFLVPNGIILMGLGLIYLAFALAICSDNQFITLARREIGSFFVTPIGYIVLLGMAVAAWIGYEFFLGVLEDRKTIPEPIVHQYYFAVMTSIFAILFFVPALTMRLFSEEKRTGSLEVLLTAPVSEISVVLSKFVAVWIFFMISWLPFGLYLIALRVEAGIPFDYRPLLSFYVALAASGAAFLAMGLFFSSLTQNQIIAAILTFVGMFLLLLTVVSDRFPILGSTAKIMMKRFSFYDLWETALSGQLLIRDVLIWASLAVLWLFLTVKVMEARRWK